MTAPTEVTSLSGSDLRAMFATATAWLDGMRILERDQCFPARWRHGTNMYLTLRSTLDEAILPKRWGGDDAFGHGRGR
jgi:hypothetical protein